MVSVIIPVYNVEQYLHKCIDSAVKQTYKDIEIILVDDCTEKNAILLVKIITKGKNDNGQNKEDCKSIP